MAFGNHITFLLIGLLTTSCLDVAPTLPKFAAYEGGQEDDDLTPGIPATPQPDPNQPGETESPQQEDQVNLLPTDAEIEADPEGSGLKLYVYYCSGCHKSFEESNKRNIGITGPQILDGYVMNFPKHKDKDWPKNDLQAFAIEKALKVPRGQEIPKKEGGADNSPEGAAEEEDTSGLPSLGIPEDTGDELPSLGQLFEQFGNRRERQGQEP